MARRVLIARAETACGVLAGPIFVTVFTKLGARRAGYDWRREPVSSLAIGTDGWGQRANFMLAGALYCIAARGLEQSSRPEVCPSVIPRLVRGVGIGLIGSGLFVTDPLPGFPPSEPGAEGQSPSTQATRDGNLHNLFAIPIFVGIPAAALICAGSAARGRDYRWAAYCAGSAIAMSTTSAVFGAAFAGAPRLAGRGGIVQRVSIATGFGWLSALSLRASAGASS